MLQSVEDLHAWHECREYEKYLGCMGYVNDVNLSWK